MAKSTRGRRRIASRNFRATPYPLLSCDGDVSKDMIQHKCSKALGKKDWEDATCSVCMEYPHNAVLLLCSSHDKGCHPYMCGTSCHYSNCLDQYKNAYTKVTSQHITQPLYGTVDNPLTGVNWPAEKCKMAQLACPLCRGQVKGWTVVEPAREFLNAKKRTCMHDKCSFIGTYKELRRHVRAQHPSARPREVDPVDEQKWGRLEREQEREDVISTITSSMPGAMVYGDYVIEGSHYGFDTDNEDDFDAADVANGNRGFEMDVDINLVNVFLLLHAFGSSGNARSYRGMRRQDRDSNLTVDRSAIVHRATPLGGFDSTDQDSDSDDGGGGGGGGGNDSMSLVSRLRHQGRVLLGRSGRRRRHREANEGRR